MKLKKIAAVLMAVGILVGAAVSCGGADKKEGETGQKVEQSDNTLVFASKDYTSINPVLYGRGDANSLLFDGLTDRDGENRVIPGLAEKWEWNEKTKTYRFNLRKDVKWHDGEKFDAEDVKFTLDAIKDPKNNSEITSDYEEIKEVKIVDEYTVDVVLSEPNVAMLDYLSVGIIPEHILAGENLVEAEYNKKPIGTGPYKFESWDVGQSITFVENTEYFNCDPNIEKIVFKIVEDPKAKVMQLKSGEIDLAQVTPKDIKVFEGNEEFDIHEIVTADYRGILYNYNNEFFKKHREVPRALNYAIDKQGIVDNILLGKGEVAYSPIQRGNYNNPDVEKFEYNPEKAKEELEKLGWKLGDDKIYEKDGEKLAFEIVCMQGDQVRIDMANICAQTFKEIGVDMKVSVKAEIDWAGQEAFLVGWGSPFDPDDHTYKAFVTGKSGNYASYSNEKVDKILAEARATQDDAKRKELYKEFQEEYANDPGYCLIAYLNGIFVADSGIKGISDETELGHHAVGVLWNVEEWTIE